MHFISEDNGGSKDHTGPKVTPTSLDVPDGHIGPKVTPTSLDVPDGHIGPKVTPTSLDFGTLPSNSSSSKQINVTNPNNVTMIWNVVITGAPLSWNPKQVTIGPNGQQTVNVTVNKDSLPVGINKAILQVGPSPAQREAQCWITVTIQ